MAKVENDQVIDYPYVVRPGLAVRFALPANLTAKEAERAAKFIASLAVESDTSTD